MSWRTLRKIGGSAHPVPTLQAPSKCGHSRQHHVDGAQQCEQCSCLSWRAAEEMASARTEGDVAG